MTTKSIDLDRVRAAMKKIAALGLPNSPERRAALAEAISAIQKDGTAALLHEYIGVKQYAHFGDQRSDHPYGYCPQHGDIVFSIGRRKYADSTVTLGADEVYALECYRDFPGFDLHAPQIQSFAFGTGLRIEGFGYDGKRTLNLFEAVRLFDALQELGSEVSTSLIGATVEAHEAAA